MGLLRQSWPGSHWLIRNLGRFVALLVLVAVLNIVVRLAVEVRRSGALAYVTDPVLEVVSLFLVLLVPAVPYLLIVALIRSRWPDRSNRIVAVVLSPMITTVLIASLAGQGHVFEPTLMIYEFGYPLPCGLLVELPHPSVAASRSQGSGRSGSVSERRR